MKKGFLIFLALVLSVVLVLAGCSTGTSSKEPEKLSSTFKMEPLEQKVTVTVGLKKVVSDAGILIGMARGYYQELGIKIEPVQFNSGQEMINQLAAKGLDVGCTVTSAALFNAMGRGIPIKIVADKGYNLPQKGYYRLVIRKDLVGEIKDYKDLKGRKIAIVGTASLDEICLDRVLNKGGLTTKEVDLQIIRSFPDIIAAFANKSIDAAMVIEPFVTQGVEKGLIDRWKDPVEYDPDAQIAILVFGPSITEKPEVAKRFMLAYVKALRDYNDAFIKGKDRERIISILMEYSTVKDRLLYEKMYPVGLNPNGYVKRIGIEKDLAWYKNRGLLESDVKAEEVIDNSYVDFALTKLGIYE
ncbi:putative aliphatic sulfonates-binding protein [Carboxydothermus islandicus]|uniref:Putative aliphatic sulfonates-binding protein n=1 Tax=Carboxydothermus islandicus TaxID=661089 RepID=A0A1L8D213_9THEO|nr:ABC transporter substrate-binding protein [Carboxydothermus islandicus]GAV25147.1 putative aliphatic sulfonates-binding protein [Carboxydothermus islandicus]